MLVFDGNCKDDSGQMQAQRVNEWCNEIRKKRGARSRGTLFYNENKELQLYLPGHATYGVNGGAAVPPEEERYIRATHGDNVDVSLVQAQSIGTDAPQGEHSVGVHMGLLEQSDEGRLNYISQQFGRKKRAGVDLRKSQALFVVVDESKVTELDIDERYKRDYQQSRELMKTSRQHLESALGYGIEDCSPEQKSIIFNIIQFEEKETEASDKVSYKTINFDESTLQSIKQEWPAAGFNKAQINALKDFKKKEWYARTSCLKLLAAGLARREENPLVKQCEKKLKEAKVASYMNEVFAKEHTWLQTGLNGHLETFKLTVPASVNSPGVSEYIKSGLVKYCRDKLMIIPRRTVCLPAGADQLQDRLKIDFFRKEVHNMLNEMKENGISLTEMSPLDIESKEFTDASGKPVTVLEKLQIESLAIYDKSLKVVNNVIDAYEKQPLVVSLDAFKEKRNDLEAQMERVKLNSIEGVQAALQTEQFMTGFLNDFVEKFQYVALNASSVTRANNKKFLKDTIDKMSSLFTVDNKFKLDIVSKGYQQAEKLKEKYDQKNIPHDKKYKDVLMLLNSRDAMNVKGRTYYVLNWQVDGKTAKDKVKLNFKPGSIKSSALNAVINKAKTLQENINDQHEAIKFCRNPASEGFQECISQLTEHIMTELDQWDTASADRSEAVVNKIKAQDVLMQSNIAR